jgi:hypothetical protein
MRTQTWTWIVQISETGSMTSAVGRSYYTASGRQLPELLELGNLEFGHVYRAADHVADMIYTSAGYPPSSQPSLPI